MQPSGKIKVVDLNQHLTCVLCGGYYIDATTIIECLHSFCKTCIVRYLQTNKFCPICDVQVHKTRPLVNIRSDQTLQDIVYKLVPGLFKSEMKRRREFYSQQAKIAKGAVPSSSEKRGEVLGSERLIFTPEDIISVSMEYCPPSLTFPLRLQPTNGDYTVSSLHSDGVTKSENHRRYLRCPGAITVGHLKRLLRAKYGLLSYHKIDVMYMHDYLYDEYTLMDLAYIYSWRRNGPLRLFYKIYERPAKTRKKTSAEKLEVILPLPCESSQVNPSSTEIAVPAPAPSVAAAPASQSHLQRHPSPPPSPQMAVEPDYVKISKPNSAALLNGQQVKLHEHESAANVTENSTYSSEKKVIPYLDNSVKLVVNLHSIDRKKKNPIKVSRKSAASHVFKSAKVNGIRKESQTQVTKHFLPRKSS